jgi:hypothetical protein
VVRPDVWLLNSIGGNTFYAANAAATAVPTDDDGKGLLAQRAIAKTRPTVFLIGVSATRRPKRKGREYCYRMRLYWFH